jgi:hypothetical protein
MGGKFDDIRSKSRIDNFLTGTSVSPDRVKPAPGETVPHVDEAVMPTSGTSTR